MVKGRIYLFCEDITDGIVVQKLIQAKGLTADVEIRTPSGGKRGITHLAKDLRRLIASARPELKKLGKRSCLAVLHDADLTTDPRGHSQQAIKQICFAENVKLVVAYDELEAWLLADSGVRAWLNRPKSDARSHDGDKRPSSKLNQWLKRANKPSLDNQMKEQTASHANGDGDSFSPSMKAALQQLLDAPCAK